MCTLQKKSHHQLAQYQTQTVILPKQHSTITTPSQTAFTCPSCSAVHYQFQLSCRKCGAYFLPQEAPAARRAPSPVAIAAAAAIFGITASVLAQIF